MLGYQVFKGRPRGFKAALGQQAFKVAVSPGRWGQSSESLLTLGALVSLCCQQNEDVADTKTRAGRDHEAYLILEGRKTILGRWVESLLIPNTRTFTLVSFPSFLLLGHSHSEEQGGHDTYYRPLVAAPVTVQGEQHLTLAILVLRHIFASIMLFLLLLFFFSQPHTPTQNVSWQYPIARSELKQSFIIIILWKQRLKYTKGRQAKGINNTTHNTVNIT